MLAKVETALELSTTHIRLWVFDLWLFEPE